jgi:hypothetical protein
VTLAIPAGAPAGAVAVADGFVTETRSTGVGGPWDHGNMRSPAASPSMIGRESELAELRAALNDTLRGRPRGVVVSREAGIGKTRLLEEFLAQASSEAIVLTGQCVDLGAVGAPYAPIKGVLRGLIDQIGADAVLEAGGPGRDALTALLPELGDSPSDRPETGSNRLHETVAVVLETVSQRSPVVVVIEDLHWADDATLNLLRFLLRALTRGRLLVVLSFRTEDVPRGHPLRGLISELERSRSVSRIDISRLNRPDVRQQVQEILGTVPDDEAFDNLFARSEGIPFFVEELVGFDETCDRPRATGTRAHRSGSEQPADRRAAVHQFEDGECARVSHSPQTRSLHSYRSCVPRQATRRFLTVITFS